MEVVEQKIVELKIPSLPEFVSVARLALSGIASRMNFQYDEIEDLKIALAEACNNAIQHAYTHNGGKNAVAIKFLVESKKLIIEVKDHGRGFNFRESQKESVDLQERGLGMFLIRALVDDFEVSSSPDGTYVKMIKILKES